MKKPDCENCETFKCEKMEKYEAYLEKRRKYKRGEPIKSLDEVYKQEFIYIFGKVTHRGWFISLQFRIVALAVMGGRVYYAIKKGESDNV